jgi:hypothetical protein
MDMDISEFLNSDVETSFGSSFYYMMQQVPSKLKPNSQQQSQQHL